MSYQPLFRNGWLVLVVHFSLEVTSQGSSEKDPQ